MVVSTAHGLKFPDFKVKYHERSLKDVQPRYANAPIDVPEDYDAVLDALMRALDERREEKVSGTFSHKGDADV